MVKRRIRRRCLSDGSKERDSVGNHW